MLKSKVPELKDHSAVSMGSIRSRLENERSYIFLPFTVSSVVA